MTEPKTGHPLPESGEARHDKIPERAEKEKGRGDEGKAVVQPSQPAANPDGEPYRYDAQQQKDDRRQGGEGGGDWDRQQGRSGEQAGGQSASVWDEQQGVTREQAGGGSEFERDQQSHQRRGQDSIESDR